MSIDQDRNFRDAAWSFGPRAFLVDSGDATIMGKKRKWAVFSDFGAQHYLVLDGVSAQMEPEELALLDRLDFPTDLHSERDRKLRLVSWSGNPFFPGIPGFLFGGIAYAINEAALGSYGDVQCVEYVICGANLIDSAELEFEICGINVTLTTSPESKILNQSAVALMHPMPTLSLLVRHETQKACEEIRNCVVVALSIVCGTYIFQGAFFVHHKQSTRPPSVHLRRRQWRPLHPASPIVEGNARAAIISAAERFARLSEQSKSTASKAIGLSIEAVNQSNALEVRAISACLAVEEIMKLALESHSAEKLKIPNGTKKKLRMHIVNNFDEFKIVPESLMAEAVDKLCMVVKSSVARDLRAASDILGFSITESDCEEFARFRNDLVHRRQLRSTNPDSPGGWNRYCRILDVMDRLIVSYFCGFQNYESRANQLANQKRPILP